MSTEHDETVELTVFIREGCHLCEDMVTALRSFQDELNFSVNLVDIDRDSTLQQAHGTRVPVLRGPDGEICHYFLDLVALKASLIAL